MANAAIANPAIVSPSEENSVAMANAAIANPAIANPAIANPAIANPAIVSPSEENSLAMANAAIANPAIVEPSEVNNAAMANPAIANPAIVKPSEENSVAMANPAIVKPSEEHIAAMASPAIGTIENSHDAKPNRPENLSQVSTMGDNALDLDPNLARSQRARSTFVFNVAIRQIGSPMDSLLFCYLWHRVEETGTTQIKISLSEMSEAIGASKRGVQDAVKRLTEMGFIENINAGTTYVPIFKLFFKIKK